MAPLDWEKLMAATPGKLSDDEVEEFYESLVKFDGKEDDVAKLKQLFKVTQSVMKSRHEQVEEIMEEMEKEAKVTKKKEQELLSEQKALEKKVQELEKYGSDIGGGKVAGTARKMRDDISELDKELEEMRAEVRDLKQELGSERRTAEKYSERISSLEKELKEMREDVDNLNRQLEEAITQMDRTTEDYAKLKIVLQQSVSVQDNLREDNEILKAKVADLTEQLADSDDAIMVAVDNKIEEWKLILQDKDQSILEQQDQIFRLREQVIATNMDTDKASVAALTKVIKDKDKQIEELSEQIKGHISR